MVVSKRFFFKYNFIGSKHLGEDKSSPCFGRHPFLWAATDGQSTQQRVEVWGSLRQCGFGTLERSILAAAWGEGTGRGLQGAGARGGWRLGWEGSQVELVRGTSWCKKGGFLTKFSGIYIDAFRL